MSIVLEQCDVQFPFYSILPILRMTVLFANYVGKDIPCFSPLTEYGRCDGLWYLESPVKIWMPIFFKHYLKIISSSLAALCTVSYQYSILLLFVIKSHQPP